MGCIRGEKRGYNRREGTMGVIALGDKRRQVASKSPVWCIREEEVIREGTMRLIVPGDKRRQVASGVGL